MAARGPHIYNAYICHIVPLFMINLFIKFHYHSSKNKKSQKWGVGFEGRCAAPRQNLQKLRKTILKKVLKILHVKSYVYMTIGVACSLVTNIHTPLRIRCHLAARGPLTYETYIYHNISFYMYIFSTKFHDPTLKTKNFQKCGVRCLAHCTAHGQNLQKLRKTILANF